MDAPGVRHSSLPVLHDVGERQLLVLLHRPQQEVLGVEVDHRVQKDLGAVAAELKRKSNFLMTELALNCKFVGF